MVVKNKFPESAAVVVPKRLDSLDGLRFIAITYVVIYHYFSRWSVSDRGYVYPYESQFNTLFTSLGHYGVQLFFVISGFVISISIRRSKSFGDFIVRRMARLWPSFVLCSCITWGVLAVFDSPLQVSPLSFISSLTFIDPEVFRRIFGSQSFQWIDGAYWTLYIEVKFYLLMGFLVLVCRLSILSSIAGLVIVGTFLYAVANLIDGDALDLISKQILTFPYLAWFGIGVAVYSFSYEKCWRMAMIALASSCVSVMVMDYMRGTVNDTLALFIIFILFVSALKVAAISRFLGSKVVSRVGVASYSLYLLHQNIALALISAGHAWIENDYTWLIYILFVYLVIVLLSLAIYHLYESPLNRYIVNSLRK